MSALLRAIWLGGLLLIVATTDASAYFDPTLGSILLQSLVGSVVAVSAALSMYWRSIRSYLRTLVSRRPGHGDGPTDQRR